ncbi:MAG: DeoR/GlpR family DNA-binding transcription regulator [Arenicellales bacterium]|jgi:DeoR family glycerol-3-phosphate regulon repressor|nr:DeoR family transcriptional regulator [Acidiferrobacteraceae bacterium]MDP6123024.1 DeoR/GlpR family DNA-binding transcription regulator [Arenicellales bacterium]|tara:strand:- start:52 stop:828 length:777 start_codon:yes stop_codon:yes gene_type:complete
MLEKPKLNSRQTAILEYIQHHGRVLVEELVDIFGTSPQTIRKDLQVLADAREVMRFHGGATLLAGIRYTDFDLRTKIATQQKELIGQTVAKLIPNDSVVMINVGTTTAAIARALKHHAGLKVVTDNVNIANDLRTCSGIEIMVPGGVVRGSDGAILGEAAVDFIGQFRADIAVIGTAAISLDGSLLDYDLREVHVARAIIENARHVILAADSSKFERAAPIKIGHLSKVHTFVTDDCNNRELRRLCKQHDIKLIKAKP